MVFDIWLACDKWMGSMIGFKSPGMGCWRLVTFQKCQFCIFSNLPVHGNVKFPELSSEGNKSEVKIGREATFHPTRRPVSIKMTDLGSRAKISVYFPNSSLKSEWATVCKIQIEIMIFFVFELRKPPKTMKSTGRKL